MGDSGWPSSLIGEEGGSFSFVSMIWGLSCGAGGRDLVSEMFFASATAGLWCWCINGGVLC